MNNDVERVVRLKGDRERVGMNGGGEGEPWVGIGKTTSRGRRSMSGDTIRSNRYAQRGLRNRRDGGRLADAGRFDAHSAGKARKSVGAGKELAGMNGKRRDGGHATTIGRLAQFYLPVMEQDRLILQETGTINLKRAAGADGNDERNAKCKKDQDDYNLFSHKVRTWRMRAMRRDAYCGEVA